MHSFLYVHPFINSSIYSFFIRSLARSFIHNFIPSYVRTFFYSCTYSFVRSFVLSSIYSVILQRVTFLQFDWFRGVIF